jgi:L-lactate dehydrogenase complex protein LldG
VGGSMNDQRPSGPTASRAAILARLSVAQRTARLPPFTAPPTGLAWPTLDREELLARFESELAALGVEHHRAASAADVRERVRPFVAGRRVLSWDPERLPYDVGSLLVEPIFGSGTLPLQASADVGVTGCHAAIAETGSLVLLSGPGTSRTVSLLPPVHLAVVRSEDLCFTMGELFATRQDLRNAASCTIVTGPSRTADIELTLTLGVHGPGEVVVVIGP